MHSMTALASGLLALGLFSVNVYGHSHSNSEQTEKAAPTVSGDVTTVGAYRVFNAETANTLLDLDASIEPLADGFKWAEGPVWVESEGYLLFSDIPNNKVMRYHPERGVDVYLENSGFSNGLLVDHQNRLVLMQSVPRQVGVMDTSFSAAKSKYKPLASHYDGKKLNSPNDVTISAQGDLYFTDPPYGLAKGLQDPAKELPYQGVYRLSTEGDLALVDRELKYPNGIALYNNDQKLIVAVSDEADPSWYSYDVNADGSLENRAVFARSQDYQFEHRPEGLPDGLKEHSSGAIFATGPGGVWVFNQDGELATHISVVGPVANLAFDSNEDYLYMTANDRLLRLKLK